LKEEKQLEIIWICSIFGNSIFVMRLNIYFLAVPKLLQKNYKEVAANRGSKEYSPVCRRLDTFFKSSSYTNVKGVVIFGY